MDKTVTQEKITGSPSKLEYYETASVQLDQQKHSRNYDRITIHDVNNSLNKINNALWLMAREENASTPLFRTCQQIVEKEIAVARRALNPSEEITS